jgi:hypothetical protein
MHSQVKKKEKKKSDALKRHKEKKRLVGHETRMREMKMYSKC